ncbi:unnamed protein product [Urochloa humidicola]
MAPKSMLVMAPRALDTVGGFPTLLNKTLVKANYTFRPVYMVYARGYGVGMLEYVARVYLEESMVPGSMPYGFEAVGPSPEMAIQEVAHGALARLRYELRELWEDPFTYLPIQGPKDPFAHFVSIPVETPLLERHMAETIFAYERAYQSMRWELDETRRRLLHLQTKVQLYM